MPPALLNFIRDSDKSNDGTTTFIQPTPSSSDYSQHQQHQTSKLPLSTIGIIIAVLIGALALLLCTTTCIIKRRRRAKKRAMKQRRLGPLDTIWECTRSEQDAEEAEFGIAFGRAGGLKNGRGRGNRGKETGSEEWDVVIELRDGIGGGGGGGTGRSGGIAGTGRGQQGQVNRLEDVPPPRYEEVVSRRVGDGQRQEERKTHREGEGRKRSKIEQTMKKV